MRVAFLTREFPPEVYGGAGVYAEHLAAELARLEDLELVVHCFGAARHAGQATREYQPWDRLAGAEPYSAVLESMSVDLAMAAGVQGAGIVHSNTWYTNLAGHWAKLLYKIPHVATSHSLEPLRRWKAEQLGAGYALSSFCEQVSLEAADAVIAVSGQMRRDILVAYPAIEPARVHVIHNGVDASVYRPVEGTDVLQRYGITHDRPSVIFVGRITQQKGIVHLLRAAEWIHPAAQLILCAGAPDTEQIRQEFEALVGKLERARQGVRWIGGMLPRPELLQLLTQARVFVCPSIYEPFGLVNLEAMACQTAVVASKVGGIPEIVVEGKTGYLVPVAAGPDGAIEDPEGFARALADRINRLIEDPGLAAEMGTAGRARVIDRFSWRAAARKTAALYREVLPSRGPI
ncbi:MAG: glycogen synthase [Actinomycetota bacterium]